jgi:hypothetical protein
MPTRQAVTREGDADAEIVDVDDRGSAHSKFGQLIVSIPELSTHLGTLELTVGRVGYPNVSRKLRAGGALLFETHDEGLFEIRVLSINSSTRKAGKSSNFAECQVSRVAPSIGFRAGYVEHDEANRPFSNDELGQLAASVEAIRSAAHTRTDIAAEQLEFLDRKLDEMAAAASRLGRRDWINLAVGTLTNVVVSAALGSDFARFLFQTASTALQWLFGNTLKLLP